MNIQPNYMNRNYNQPAFCARLSKDKETKRILKENMIQKDGPEYIYSLIKNLDALKSEDEISISVAKSDADFLTPYIFKNKRTGNSVTMYKELTSNNMFSYYDDKRSFDLDFAPAEAIYRTVVNNLDELFDDTSRKPGRHFINPARKYLSKEVDVSDINLKISKLKNNEKEINKLQEKAAKRRIDYVLNMLG